MANRSARISRAGAAKCARAVVAFQAQGEDHWPLQQARVRGPVWYVAGFAAFHAHGRMLINKWPTFLGVALQAGLFVRQRLPHQVRARSQAPRRIEGTMRIVTVRALDDSFVHPVLEGHGKLSPYVGVTPVAKLRLLLREKELRSLRFVNGVTVRANDVVIRVRRAANVRARERFPVASEASVQNLTRLKL